ncbi:dynein axonemal heavy chain 7-like [Macrosteles quadrilineatus]|uniref:dynein axonemal heavy chain 7-like n=1 Tax=Macrosteles quadrilineatus TaxID=74068 RepID=UPI0023E09B91|nr:dynein axonemal heavy chain 7-like [Macrosteles quadrilineatus]
MPKGQEEIQEENLRNLIFTTALTCDSEDKKYEEVGSLDNFMKALDPIIENYNSTQETKRNIVLFRFALEHLSRLCRVLSISGGSCLMLGMRGSGRQTITQLAALLCKADFHQPSVVHNYGFSEWRDDLKKVLINAGGNNTKTVFFVSENELTDEMFLQDLDMILSTGQIPDMFSSSELERIYDMVRLSAQGGNRNLDINPLTVFAFFVSRCRQNLHIILSLSSISYSFRRWLSLYPSLLNHCTVDWVEDWPEEALEKIAFHYWDGLEIEETILGSAVKLSKYIHVTARETSEKFYSVTGRKCYVTSASYLMMVKKYRHLITQKQEEIVHSKAQFITGLEKLEFASKQVSVMQKELEALQPQLQVAAAETEKMMEVIERETVIIEQASGLVREDEKVAKIQAAAANNLKIECEADLALAIPILEEAVAALNTLKPTDITLVKSMKNPPDTVKLVMAAVCVMKDIKPEKIPDPNTPGRKILDYWGPSKRLLGDMAFLQQLKDYDKDNISPPIMAMIRKQYLPNKDFKPLIVAKASSAAEGLCKWVIAMDMYDAVAKEVAPKKAKLEIAEREFAATMAILEEKRAQVRMLEEKLMDLNAKLDAAQQRKKVLEDEVGMCENKLWKAQKLIGGLGGEKGRWMETANSLQTCFDNLAGDILLSCGVIAYLAPLTFQFRQSLLHDWCKICCDLEIPKSETFSFVKVLGFDINIQNWNIFGLPRDEFSIENAVILENTVRCPLLIDPQGHANRWIKAKEKSNKLQVIRLSDEDYMKTVETCMVVGNPVLLENVEEDLNAILLSPLFVRRTIDPDGKKLPCIYITTRLQNPTFTPTVFNFFSVINFTLTLNGLEDKLLDIVIAKERPDLQDKKQAMMISSSKNKTKLQQVESKILDTLSYTKGNILENEAAIEILDTAKSLSVEIQDKQKLAKIIEEEIHSYCQLYYAVVEHSARLYFCLTNLSNINFMYQFSLDWFLKTYITSIDTANKSQIMEVRLQYLQNRITYNLYRNVCCSLFEKHRILFCLLLCSNIELAKKTILEEDLNFFIGVKIESEGFKGETNSPVEWITDIKWKQIVQLDQLSSYSGFAESLASNHEKWEVLQNSDKLDFPDPWNSQLSEFQKLNIIKVIYPDKVRDSIEQYVEGCMGKQYTLPFTLDLTSSFEDSNCLTPLLFIMGPGSDPAPAVRQFAKKKLFQNRLHTISLGVDQGEAASRLISRSREEGSWVLLQNCHLAPDYMPHLERVCDNLTLLNTSMEFRLWLTSAPSTQFPVSILQSSVKITTDLPPGLKRRLLLSFQSEPIIIEDFFYGCPGKDRAFAKLLYSLCFLHASVQERQKYGHLGWNILYKFCDTDFNMSLQQLQVYSQHPAAERPQVLGAVLRHDSSIHLQSTIRHIFSGSDASPF